jgi:Mg2+-importing ATPase
MARASDTTAATSIPHPWSLTPDEALSAYTSSRDGLSADETASRLDAQGPNTLRERDEDTLGQAILRQLRSPLTLLLGGAGIVAALVGEWTDTVVIGAILLLGSAVSLTQERRASSAIAKLRARVRTLATVRRGGAELRIPTEQLVPGDVVLLSAGSLVPADALLLEARDFHVSEATLTGEPWPVEKQPGPSAPDAPLAKRTGTIYLGTSVRSGTATALVTATGSRTELGAIAHRLVLRAPETDFERGLRRFGLLLTRVVGALVLLVFALHVVAEKPAFDSLLFAVALAVGIAPEMLPAIVAVTLARGAREMAALGVIVKRPNAIESFGSMDVLCTDKTGTLTEGVVRLSDTLDPEGRASTRVRHLARVNAHLETGLANPLDEAIIRDTEAAGDLSELPPKVDEIPWDFARKRLSVVVLGAAVPGAPDASEAAVHTLVTKGAFAPLLAVCTAHRGAEGRTVPLDDDARAALLARYEAWSREGRRVLGVATRSFAPRAPYTRNDETELCFEGFLCFDDRPKVHIAETVQALAVSGVALKIITGDNRYVAAHVAAALGLGAAGDGDTADAAPTVLTGDALDRLTDDALPVVAERTHVFAEVDPRQKERVVLALRKAGHVVGYMGDGVNDAPALHAADVGISVDGAVDVAREAADFVLLEPDLGVLRAGVLAGRRSFANTLKYLYTTQSASFGNMLSMAVASAFLAFLPLTAAQILLNNFLSDLPAMALPSDTVDAEDVAAPRRWDLASLQRSMLAFGALSSVFDLLTFGLLLFVARATPATFRTGWFVESLLTEVAVALVVRTRRPFFRSRPGHWLVIASVAVAAVALAIPWIPAAATLGVVPLPAWLLATLVGVTLSYLVAVEGLKRLVFRRHAATTSGPASPQV